MTEVELPFSSQEFENIWQEWIKYRKEQHFPCYKPIGLKRTLTELFNDSDGDEQTAIKMIINAMKNTWRGIFKVNVYGNKSVNKGKSTGAYELLEQIRSDSSNNS